MPDRRPATTISELDVHLGYVQQALRDLQAAVGDMATKQDITHLAERMDTFATKDELARLEAKLDSESTPNKIKRWGGLATSISAIMALVIAVVVGVATVTRVADTVPVKSKP